MSNERRVAKEAYDSGARVLVILVDGEQVMGHIAGMISRGFTLLVRHPTGRVERPITWERIGSIAAFEEEPEVLSRVVDDGLQAITDDLVRRANARRRRSLAERIVDERGGHDGPA